MSHGRDRRAEDVACLVVAQKELRQIQIALNATILSRDGDWPKGCDLELAVREANEAVTKAMCRLDDAVGHVFTRIEDGENRWRP